MITSHVATKSRRVQETLRAQPTSSEPDGGPGAKPPKQKPTPPKQEPSYSSEQSPAPRPEVATPTFMITSHVATKSRRVQETLRAQPTSSEPDGGPGAKPPKQKPTPPKQEPSYSSEQSPAPRPEVATPTFMITSHVATKSRRVQETLRAQPTSSEPDGGPGAKPPKQKPTPPKQEPSYSSEQSPAPRPEVATPTFMITSHVATKSRRVQETLRAQPWLKANRA